MAAKFKWPTKRLGEIAEFRNGVNYNKSSFGLGVKVVGVSNFQDFTRPRYAELEQINPEGIVTGRNILRDGDIVFVRSNGNRELIGRSLFIEKPPEEVTHSAFTIRLRFTSGNVIPKFFAYCFRTPTIRQALSAYGGGTNISNLNQDILNALEVPSPSLPTQRKITTILSAYDDLIENNLRRIKILEEMAQNLYREWFVKFRFPGHLNARFTDSPLGRIPEGWAVAKIKDVADVNARSIRKEGPQAQIVYIDIASVSPGSVDKMETMAFSDAPSRARRITRHGDIIWSSVRPNRRSFSLIIDPPANLIVSTGFAVISAKKVPFTYLYQTVTVDDFVVYLVNHAKGSAYPAVNADDFENADILVPDKHLLSSFDDVVLPIAIFTHRLKAKNTSLRLTRDLLLPRLISGEVNVSELDIVVPEEVGA